MHDVVLMPMLEDVTAPRNGFPLSVDPTLLLRLRCPMHLCKRLGRHNPVFTAQF